jgi:hypothetical protein
MGSSAAVARAKTNIPALTTDGVLFNRELLSPKRTATMIIVKGGLRKDDELGNGFRAAEEIECVVY